MLPLMVATPFKLFDVGKLTDSLKIKFRYYNLIGILGIVLPFALFGWVNYKSYGNPLRLAGTLTNVRTIDAKGNPVGVSLKDDNILDNYKSF